VVLWTTWYVGQIKQRVGISDLLFRNQYVVFMVNVHKKGFPAVHSCTFDAGF